MVKVKEHVFMKDKYAKQIFNTKENIEYVIRLVSKILEIPISELEKDFELLPVNIMSNKETKNSEVDALYEHNKIYINIEINLSSSNIIKKKNNSYCAQLILRKVKIGENYDFNKIRQININAFDYYKENKFIYKSTTREEESNKLRDDNIIFYDINMDYLMNKSYNEIKEKGKESLEYLLYFLICEDKEVRGNLYKKDNIMEKITEDIDNLTAKLDEYLYYNRDELYKMAKEYDRNEGKKEGYEEGKKEGKKEIAKAMLKENFDKEIISKITSLTKEEIEMLKNK